MDRHKHYGSLGVIHRNEGVGMRSTQSFFEKDHQGELSNTRPLWNNSINTQTKSLFGSSKYFLNYLEPAQYKPNKAKKNRYLEAEIQCSAPMRLHRF